MRLSAPAAVVVTLALAALSASPTEAKMPDPRFSTIPTVLAGSPSGALIPTCGGLGYSSTAERMDCFRVVLRDVSNAPLAYMPVTLDLGATACRVYADDRAGTTVDCNTGRITRLSGLDGVVEFAPRFSGGCAEALVHVVVNGLTLRDVPARSTDLDLDGNTGLGDFWHVANNFLRGEHDPSTDFDPCAGEPGLTSLADLSVFSAVLLRGGAGTVCP